MSNKLSQNSSQSSQPAQPAGQTTPQGSQALPKKKLVLTSKDFGLIAEALLTLISSSPNGMEITLEGRGLGILASVGIINLLRKDGVKMTPTTISVGESRGHDILVMSFIAKK